MSLHPSHPRCPCGRSLVDRDERAPITASPAGRFTASASPSKLRGRADPDPLADWVPADHLL